MNLKLEEDLEESEAKIQMMLKAMKISKMEQILPIYQDLNKDSLHIDSIIREYKETIQRTKYDYERMKRALYRKTQSRRSKSMIGKELSRFGNDELNGILKTTNNGKMTEMENTMLKKNSALVKEKQEFERVFNVFQNVCLTVSRIMFQLEP